MTAATNLRLSELPGAILWVPTLINLFIAAEIGQLWWERSGGVHNSAQGEMGPYFHIIGISAPGAAVLVIGWVALVVLGAASRGGARAPNWALRSVAAGNIAAPVVLHYLLTGGI